MIKFFLWIFSVVFLILGVIGLLIPIVPQVPFFVVSVVLAATASPSLKSRIREHDLFQKHIRPNLKENSFAWNFFYKTEK